MTQRLTASLEDYLEAISELIAGNGHAHTKEIAEKLNVKMPSVTGALRQLDKMGYIVYSAHYPVELTAEGKRVADEVVRRHEVLKNFFTGVLGLSPEKAESTACYLEHAVDGDTIQRFVIFSQAIGHRRDARELQGFLTEAMSFLNRDDGETPVVMAELAAGEAAKIFHIGRNLRDEKSLPVAEGDIIVCQSFSLDKTSLRIKKGDSLVEIPARIAENVWVLRSR